MSRLSEEQQRQVEAATEMSTQTKRALSPGLEAILYQAFPVLDHGFVRVVDYMGNDDAIVQAARVSYGKGTKRKSEDEKLINYLMKNRHTTPFEMAEIKLHVKLPIFVARQWIRHRTASVNEYSARYSILDREFYVPLPEHLAAQSQSNRQGRGGILQSEESEVVVNTIRSDSENAYVHYLSMLNSDESGEEVDPARQGLARELARINLSLNFYTQWYWKINLHNLLNFLRLRADPHAQYEIRAYAAVILDLVQRWVPSTYEAFVQHQMQALTLSRSEVGTLRGLLNDAKDSDAKDDRSARLRSDLLARLGEIES